MDKTAKTEFPVHDLVRLRWSPRAFADRPVEPEKLRSLAARWAPSSYNEQPWAYLVATREQPQAFARLLSVLVEFNVTWAQRAPVLMLSVAKLRFARNGEPNRHAFHDVGLASANLITQATATGLFVHQMAGIQVAKARKVFAIPEGWEPVAGKRISRLWVACSTWRRMARQHFRSMPGAAGFGRGALSRRFGPILWGLGPANMNETLEFLVHHGYTVLFAWVFVEQIGLPIPSVPMLLAAGALAGTGRLSLTTAVVVAIAAAMLSDSFWYELGRRRGAKVLQMLCRISLEPDSCVRRTENLYGKLGARSLLLAKFVPGLNTASPPLAGVFRMRLRRFLFFDAMGVILWVGAYAGLGYAFSDQLERVADRALKLGTGLVALLLAAFGGFLLWKYVKRQRFLRELRVARITPEELKQLFDAGEGPVIVDLRHALDFEAEPETIPGAIRISAEDLEKMNQHIPPDREVVLYCT